MLAGKGLDVTSTLPSDVEIEFSCRFARSPRSLFEAWTRPEHLRQWWGCEGTQLTHCAIDLREGGAWSMEMRMQDGSLHPFYGTYREIAAPHKLVYTECYDMPQFGRPEWLNTVTFAAVAGGTVLTQTLRHKTKEIRDAHLRAGMQEGTIAVFSRLDALAASIDSLTTAEV